MEAVDIDESVYKALNEKGFTDMFFVIFDSALLAEENDINTSSTAYDKFYRSVLAAGGVTEFRKLYYLILRLYNVRGENRTVRKGIDKDRVKEIYRIIHNL